MSPSQQSRGVTLEPLSWHERMLVLRIRCDGEPAMPTPVPGEPQIDGDAAIATPLLPDLAPHLPISDLVMASGGTVQAPEDTADVVRRLLERTYQALSELYPPFMRQRSGSMWIARPHIVAAPDAAADTAITSALAAGYRALAVVAAQELARKQVVVNYVDISDADQIGRLAALWRTQYGPIMTGQTIELEAPDADAV